MLCDCVSQTQRAELWKNSGELVNSGIDNQPQMSPWQSRGGRAIKKNSRSNQRRGRGGSFKLKTIFLEPTTPSAPDLVASQHLFDGAATPPLPSFAKGGDLASTPTFGNNEMRILHRALCPRLRACFGIFSKLDYQSFHRETR